MIDESKSNDEDGSNKKNQPYLIQKEKTKGNENAKKYFRIINVGWIIQDKSVLKKNHSKWIYFLR